jgi:hypothetical protein
MQQQIHPGALDSNQRICAFILFNKMLIPSSSLVPFLDRGIETCGILSAHLSANDSVFTVSTLIIPKQRGTSDTVEMLSEEDMLTVHLERELYPLGWIHTHPSQVTLS